MLLVVKSNGELNPMPESLMLVNRSRVDLLTVDHDA
jgi:hypothetical protein